MGLFSFLTGKAPEEIELIGDNFFKVKEFGAAKIEYEKALNKTESRFPEKENLIQRLYEKIKNSKEALALAHQQNSEHLIASQNYTEAEDLLELAFELTENVNLKEEVKTTLKKLHQAFASNDPDDTKMFSSGSEPFPTAEEIDSDEEYFSILCNALPKDIRKIYLSYDQAFKQGFIALNNGDFEVAVEKFTDSINGSGLEQPLIPLELSTALVNLGQYDRARKLLEEFIEVNDQEVRAYQVLCDIYWVTKNHDDAVALIEQCPGALKETFPVRMLLGETYYQMKRYADAESLFLACENSFGQNEIITRSLAKTYEAMGDLERARDIYAQILNGCTKCGVRTDPFVLRRYAELCFACGERSSQLLDLYLSILQEDPDSKDDYYQRIYELYTALGNTKEAARYQSSI
ncbi:MAG: tetratricopeptide repeat protein [Desulfobacteraceae bacterium]|nr:tetratricopeptide repeat protein [Desulfobacteraceae bacterium]MBC2754514.1 tetratricopeptide repeat protein [Desulfobacteraceae bacterium]